MADQSSLTTAPARVAIPLRMPLLLTARTYQKRQPAPMRVSGSAMSTSTALQPSIPARPPPAISMQQETCQALSQPKAVSSRQDPTVQSLASILLDRTASARGSLLDEECQVVSPLDVLTAECLFIDIVHCREPDHLAIHDILFVEEGRHQSVKVIRTDRPLRPPIYGLCYMYRLS